MKTKTLTISEMKQKHIMLCSEVTFEYFMDSYCKQLLSEYDKVEVVVSGNFKFEFKKCTS